MGLRRFGASSSSDSLSSLSSNLSLRLMPLPRLLPSKRVLDELELELELELYELGLDDQELDELLELGMSLNVWASDIMCVIQLVRGGGVRKLPKFVDCMFANAI